MWEMLEPDIECGNECWGTGPPPEFLIPPPPVPRFIQEINRCTGDITHDMGMCSVIPIFDASYHSSPSLQTSAMIAVFTLLLVIVLISSLFVWKHKRKVQNFLQCKPQARGGHLDTSGGTHSVTYEDPVAHLRHLRPLVMQHRNMEILHSKSLHFPSGYPMPRSPPRFVCSSPGPDPYRSHDNVYEELPPLQTRHLDGEYETTMQSDDDFAEDELSLTADRSVNSNVIHSESAGGSGSTAIDSNSRRIISNLSNTVSTIYHERGWNINGIPHNSSNRNNNMNCNGDCHRNNFSNRENNNSINENNKLLEHTLNEHNALLSSSSSSTMTTSSAQINQIELRNNNKNKLLHRKSIPTTIGLFRNRKIRYTTDNNGNNNGNNSGFIKNNNYRHQHQQLLQKQTIDEIMLNSTFNSTHLPSSDIIPTMYDKSSNNNILINCFSSSTDNNNVTEVERRNRLNNRLSNHSNYNSISTIFQGSTLNNHSPRRHLPYYQHPNNKSNANNERILYTSKNKNNRSRTNATLDRRRYSNKLNSTNQHQQSQQICDVNYTDAIFHGSILYDTTTPPSSLCPEHKHQTETMYNDQNYLYPYSIPEFSTFRNGQNSSMTIQSTDLSISSTNTIITPILTETTSSTSKSSTTPSTTSSISPCITTLISSVSGSTSIPQSQSLYSRDFSFGSDSGYSHIAESGCSADDSVAICDSYSIIPPIIDNSDKNDGNYEITIKYTSSNNCGKDTAGVENIGCEWTNSRNKRRNDNYINSNCKIINKNGTIESS